jgi:hypothetical protein
VPMVESSVIGEFQRRRLVAKAWLDHARWLVLLFFVGASATLVERLQTLAFLACLASVAGFFAVQLWANFTIRCPNCGRFPMSRNWLQSRRNQQFPPDPIACAKCGTRLK